MLLWLLLVASLLNVRQVLTFFGNCERRKRWCG